MKTVSIFSLIFILIVLLGCEREEHDLATVETFPVTNITSNSATSGGTIIDYGGTRALANGVAWNTSPMPWVKDYLTNDSLGTDTFVSQLKNLEPATTYYVRAYVTNSEGTSYGEQVSFTTLSAFDFQLHTVDADSISYYSAFSGGYIQNPANTEIISRGVCWDTLPSPETSDFLVQAESADSIYACELQNLLPGRTYYYRAFVIVESGTLYGEEKEFTTLAKGAPIVFTNDADSISYFSANSGGRIRNRGQYQILSRGICWDTLPAPEISDFLSQSASEDSIYTCELKNLVPGTKYYYRAFITYESGTAYGSQKDFTTPALPDPEVETFDASGISATQAVFNGQVTAESVVNIIDMGFCYSESVNPDLGELSAAYSGETGNYSSHVFNLDPGTTYYVRAYATTCEGIIYGNEVFFTTNDTLPSVTTDEITSVTHESVIVAGLVTSDGGTRVTSRGFCYSINTGPTLGDQFMESGEGTGLFLETIRGLDVKTTYFVRAYATNENGTVYGEEFQFTTYDTAKWILVFEDDFEDYTTGEHPSKWTVRFDGDDAEVSEDVADEGIKSFMLISKPSWARVEAFPLDSVTDEIRFEGSISVDQANKGYFIGFGYKESTSTYRPRNGVGLANSNLFNFIGLDTIAWTPKTWYRIEVELDLVGNTARLWVDDQFIAQVNDQLAPKEQMDDFVISGNNFSGTNSKAYYDDIKLYFRNPYSCKICK